MAQVTQPRKAVLLGHRHRRPDLVSLEICEQNPLSHFHSARLSEVLRGLRPLRRAPTWQLLLTWLWIKSRICFWGYCRRSSRRKNRERNGVGCSMNTPTRTMGRASSCRGKDRTRVRRGLVTACHQAPTTAQGNLTWRHRGLGRLDAHRVTEHQSKPDRQEAGRTHGKACLRKLQPDPRLQTWPVDSLDDTRSQLAWCSSHKWDKCSHHTKRL